MESDLYKNLPDGCYEFKEAHLPDCVELMVEGFSSKNDIWSTENIDKSVLRTFFVNELRDVLAAQARLRDYRKDNVAINFIYVVGEKLISCFFSYEIYEYQRLQATYVAPADIPLYRELERQGKELAKAVDFAKMERGKHIYAAWGAHVNDPSIPTQCKVRESAEYIYSLQRQGFQSVHFRSTNPGAVYLMIRAGVEKLIEIDFHKADGTYKLYFLGVDFSSSKFQQTNKKAREQPIQKEIRAKL